MVACLGNHHLDLPTLIGRVPMKVTKMVAAMRIKAASMGYTMVLGVEIPITKMSMTQMPMNMGTEGSMEATCIPTSATKSDTAGQ